ncbi:MAG TPA: HDOD domain-containing protein [Desulfomonilia bacterium]|nr:HDOD domain-containing protein [Desulfomonilia bacterium]
MRILVVDDELVSREKMKHIMSALGDCDEVASGQDALRAFTDASTDGNRYDLIMLDISMPEMDGTEVLNRIRTAEKDKVTPREAQVKIFMVTAASDKDVILTCIKSGCNDYIMKPFSRETVVKKLRDNGLVDQQQNGPSNGSTSDKEKKNPIVKIMARFNRGEIELPPMPRIQSKFHELIKAGANLQDIGGLLKQDPAISAKLISISNSTYYRGFTENTTVEQAIGRLGLLATKQTVDAISNRSLYLGTNPKYADVMEKLWEHSLSCAHASQVITEIKALKLSEDAFTLGLLHDIGKLMLLRVFGEIEKRDKDAKSISSDELLDSLAAYHGKTGALLMKRWNFPGVYMQVTESHDHMEDIEKPSMELLVVNLANVLVKSMGYGTPNPEGITPETTVAVQAFEISAEQIRTIREQVKVRIEELKAYLQ